MTAASSSRPRILLISHTAPWPPTSGGRQRANLLHAALSQIGKVDLLLFNQTGSLRDAGAHLGILESEYGLVELVKGPPPPADGDRGQWWKLAKPFWRLARFLAPMRQSEEMRAAYCRHRRRVAYDAVVSFHLGNAWMCGALEEPGMIVDVDDLTHESFAWRRQTLAPGSPVRLLLRWKEWQLKRWARAATDSARHLFVSKEEDRAFVGPQRSTLLCNVPFQRTSCLPYQPREDGARVMLVVANLGYLPNVDGVHHFVTQLWPRLSAADPSLVLRLVGGGVTSEKRAEWTAHAGVELAGYASDLEDEYARALFCLVPNRYGAGSNIKFVEALAYGRPVACTPKGCNGFKSYFAEGEHFHCARSDDEFVAICRKLADWPEQTLAMGASAAKVAQTHFNRDIFIRTMGETMNLLLSKA